MNTGNVSQTRSGVGSRQSLIGVTPLGLDGTVNIGTPAVYTVSPNRKSIVKLPSLPKIPERGSRMKMQRFSKKNIDRLISMSNMRNQIGNLPVGLLSSKLVTKYGDNLSPARSTKRSNSK